jgi:signal transduction histidine kinase
MNQRILVIEDSPQVVEWYFSVLQPEQSATTHLQALMGQAEDVSASATKPHFEVVVAHQGEEGVQQFADAHAQGRPFAVAFVDMRMPPGIDGLETARRLRQIDERLYVVIATAFSDHEIDEIQAALQHDVMLLRKPFTGEELLQHARNLCNSWNRDDELHQLRLGLEAQVEARTQELISQREQLEHASRLASLGALAGGIAHELRSPLAALRMNLESMQLGVSSGNWASEKTLQQISRSLHILDKTSSVLHQMRKFGHPHQESEVSQAISLSEVLQGVLLLSRNLLNKEGVQLLLDIPSDLPTFPGNAVQIEQVLLNLVNNARHAMLESPMKQLTFRAYTAEQCLVVEVEDTGCGMSEEVQERMFTPFFTTKDPEQGLGLGMDIVKQVIERHQGKIAVRSVLEEGSCFTLRFPLTRSKGIAGKGE